MLERVADLLPQELAASVDREALILLSPWATAGRYPEDLDDPSDEETATIVSAGRAVVGQVTQLASAR